MTQNATSVAQGCIFCAIVARQAEASVVYEDETAMAFMDLNPVTPGHLLVVPREHAVGRYRLDGLTVTSAMPCPSPRSACACVAYRG